MDLIFHQMRKCCTRGEGQIPVSFTSEPNWEALAFPKEYRNGKNTLMRKEMSE